jgi:glycerol-3-phosphate acyltransferase PlsX
VIEKLAPVAVDAMGGDHAPGEIVQGAVNAARKGLPVVLVGPEERVREELRRRGGAPSLPIEIRNATEVVEMHDHPGQAMRRKKDNSIRVCFELVQSGRAGAMVSAGNSGAVMAGAIFVLGRPPGVERPAIITTLPALQGSPIMLDMGAVVDAKAIHLVQFALMGETYARRVFAIPRPRVAILANGEEDSKGTELTRAAAAALRRSSIAFVGYCEGRDLLTGEFDVIATDGFTGNVALKAIEGTIRSLLDAIRGELESSVRGKLGGLLIRPGARRVQKRLDPEEYGGAYLLGLRGLVVIAHGSSSRVAIANAVRLAARGVEHDVVERLAQRLPDRVVASARSTTPTPEK